MPARTMALSSSCMEAPGTVPMLPASVPAAMVTPAATSFLRFAAMMGPAAATRARRFSPASRAAGVDTFDHSAHDVSAAGAPYFFSSSDGDLPAGVPATDA